jgi:hypothetical protein
MAFTPKELTVQITPDVAIPFKVTKVTQTDGRTTLRARVSKASDAPSALDTAFMVSTASTPDTWSAVVVLPGEDVQYNVNVKNGVTTSTPIPTAFTCGNEAPAAKGTTEATAADIVNPNTTYAPITKTAAVATSGTPIVINVLYIQNPESVAYYALPTTTSTVVADCSNFIEGANAILENSLVTNFTWKYTAVVPCPAYTEDKTLLTDLLSLAGSLNSFVTQNIAKYNAAQVVMLAGEHHYNGIGQPTPTAAGQAYMPNTTGGNIDGTSGNLAYSALQDPCDLGGTVNPDGSYPNGPPPIYIVAHEMAHNFGCHHDRTTESATPGDGKYYYGYSISDYTAVNAGLDLLPQTYGTVMSYNGATRIPYFSNPNVNVTPPAYESLGQWFQPPTQPVGVAIDQPLAAYNALMLINNAGTISGNQAQTAPVITQQPQSVTIDAGGSFTLSVSATGGNLNYQWYQGSTSLNWTASSYSVSNANNGNAGTYSVVVTNAIGTVTSNPATVTVNAVITPPNNPPSGGGGSGGGGGGGAPSDWFLGALMALAAARWLSQRRRTIAHQ